MRNVNSWEELEGVKEPLKFYINYEECKYYFSSNKNYTNRKFYINYEECKSVKIFFNFDL
ncbi:TPA: hypothetical protein I9148_002314 [Clostridium perfringens]|nr:hypothetical protein [Clostridium perfringens]